MLLVKTLAKRHANGSKKSQVEFVYKVQTCVAGWPNGLTSLLANARMLSKSHFDATARSAV